MKLLLHICCAPCSAYIIKDLRKDNIDITGYWYNPNIHPYDEYKKRLDTLKEYSKMIDLDVIYNDNYGLIEFTKNVINDLNNRCGYCYTSRLEEVVKYAKENGYDAFSSTLFISPYQKHELLKSICEDLSKKYDIEFLYRDFRPYYREGQSLFRETGLYMQKYCGCIFSEMDSKLKEIKRSKEDLTGKNKITERKIRLNKIKGLDIRSYNKSDYEFIYDIKKKNNLNEKENKKLIDRFVKDLNIITLNEKNIGFYKDDDIYLMDKYKEIYEIILNETIVYKTNV